MKHIALDYEILLALSKWHERDFDKNGIPDELQKVIIKIKPRPIFNRYACEYTLNIPLDLNFKQLSDENHIDIQNELSHDNVDFPRR